MYKISESLSRERKHAHSQAVGQISYIIAHSYGYLNMEATLIQQAAQLHDIGKSYISKEILNKPGKLTDEEFALVKRHAVYGASHLLKQAQLLLTAAVIALQHHEQVSGGGYEGLTNIHAYAKLVAVADVFDALISPRAYKHGWPPYEVEDYMKDNKDSRFEPELVDALLKCFDEVLQIYDYTSY